MPRKYYRRKYPVRKYPAKKKTKLVKKSNTYYRDGYITVPRVLKADYSCVLLEDSDHVKFLINASSGETNVYKNFQMSQIYQSINYQTLFDSYRINAVEVNVIPVMSTVVNRPYDDTTTGNVVTATPMWCAVIDLDSIDAETFENMRNRKGAIVRKGTQGAKFKFTPRIHNESAGGGVTTPNGRFNTICDMASPDINHYGLKFVVQGASPSVSYNLRIETKYYMSFFSRR